jgi:hypothetical protein
LHDSYRETKNPAYLRKQGWEKSGSILYLLTPGLSKIPTVRPPGAVDSPRLYTQPW